VRLLAGLLRTGAGRWGIAPNPGFVA